MPLLTRETRWPSGYRAGLRIEKSGFEPWPDHCVVFLGKTLYSHTVPLSTQEYKLVPANCQGNLAKFWEVTCDGLASDPGGVAILLIASCYGNRDKSDINGPLDS